MSLCYATGTNQKSDLVEMRVNFEGFVFLSGSR